MLRGHEERERGETAVAPHGAFPAMQSLKGEPRHYAVAVVHGPLPHHPFDSSNPLVAFLFLLSSPPPLSLSLFLFLLIALSFSLPLEQATARSLAFLIS